MSDNPYEYRKVSGENAGKTCAVLGDLGPGDYVHIETASRVTMGIGGAYDARTQATAPAESPERLVSLLTRQAEAGEANESDRFADIRFALAHSRLTWIVKEAISALCYAYEAGQLPNTVSIPVEKYITPDGGALNSLKVLERLLEMTQGRRTISTLDLFTAISEAFGVDLERYSAKSEAI